ncbi:MAG: DsbA family protein [Acholeplasma sp.]|jgi:protein disulfide-isomerase|nr:DsbA family protein [Acholeplasma sp.]
MELEIWIDFTCPFCYLGKIRFFKALARFKHKQDVHIIFRSYLLSPNDNNQEQLNGHAWLAKHKDISMEQAQQLNAGIETMAFDEGVWLDFSKITPRNTLCAHKIMKQLNSKDQIEFVNRVFDAQFVKHLDISSLEVLTELATPFLDPIKISEIYLSNTSLDLIKEDIDLSTKFGLKGVPFFVLNRKYSISGAQDELYFYDMLEELYFETRPKKPIKTSYCVGEHCERKVKK